MNKILWTDTETTGLASSDRLLEVAVVVTNDNLAEVAAFCAVTDAARRVDMSEVDSRVQEMHATSGLWCASLLGGQPLASVETALVEFIREHFPDVVLAAPGSLVDPQAAPILGGSTPSFDRGVWHRWLPEAVRYLRHRHLDVSSLNELALRVWPSVHDARPKDQTAHRALADVRHSIAVAQYYARSLGIYPVTTNVWL